MDNLPECIKKNEKETHDESSTTSTNSTNHKKHSNKNKLAKPGYLKNKSKKDFYTHKKNGQLPLSKNAQTENHRERLIDQVTNGKYECMICYSVIRPHVATMHCPSCYHIYHLYCLKQWSRSDLGRGASGGGVASAAANADHHTTQSAANNEMNKSSLVINSWRCPACQQIHDLSNKNGFRYFCYCGKQRDPPFTPHYTPHSCGEMCAKLRSEHCSHPCNILCHPGPCPPCEAFITVTCPCGKRSESVKCSQSSQFHCSAICERPLNCTIHQCQRECHAGDCDPCSVLVEQTCACTQSQRCVLCGSTQSQSTTFQCNKICQKKLDCENHTCPELCHSGPCSPCTRQPALVTHCPCGKKLLIDLIKSGKSSGPRESCLTEIPSCKNVCDRIQPLCGHACKSICHDGPCPPCPNTHKITCRCGRSTKQLPCSEALAMSRCGNEFLCQRKCKRIKSCGVHRCGQNCCIDLDHICPLQCGKLLNCGEHTCENRCHLGPCQPCQRMNLVGISCHCGGMFIPPPVPCGTPSPQCPYPCARERHCSHPPDHPCHPDQHSCPPCTVLMEKLCPGGHKVLTNIPCHQEVVTCGMRCNRALVNCSHLCWRSCHPGDNCLRDAQGKELFCKQLCEEIRSNCKHVCGLPCHPDKPCQVVQSLPQGKCRQNILITCACGYRQEQWPCPKYQEFLQKGDVVSRLAAMEINAQDTAIAELGGLKLLDCDSSCIMAKRLAGLSEVLQSHQHSGATILDSSGGVGSQQQGIGAIATATGGAVDSQVETPPYVAFLKEYGSKNMPFVLYVEEEFDKLLRALYESTRKTFTNHFAPQHFDKRRFIHELSDFYQMESESYGLKPNRNIKVMATRNKSFAPSVKLSSVLLRDYPSLRKPMPVKKTAVNVPLSEMEPVATNMTLLGDPNAGWSRPLSTSNKINAPTSSSTTTTTPQDFVSLASHNGWWNMMEDPSKPLD